MKENVLDYVYVCRDGDNEELRYSLRSLVKNAPKGNVWVVGGKPDWYKGNFIPVKNAHNKFENIKNCMKVVAETKEISDDFVSMHDDFFIVKKINKFEIYHGGYLEDRVSEYNLLSPNSYYTRLLANTHKRLKKMKYKNPLDYDIHVPITMNKDNLKISLSQPYLERSMYGNMFDIGGIKREDVKVYFNGSLMERSYDYLSNSSEYISTTDRSFNDLKKDLLEDMFPDATIYEA